MQRTDGTRRRGIGIGGLLTLAGLLWLSGCHERDPVPPPTPEQRGADFFPIQINRFWIYDVEEKFWDENTPTVTRFQFRELVDTVFRGADGQLNYRILRSRRADASVPSWRDDSVIAVVVNDQYVRRTTTNTPTLALVFPVREAGAWNPNVLSTDAPATRHYEALDQPMVLPNGQHFERTVRVVDEGEDNLFFLKQTSAAYARGVGLIRRDRQTYDYCDYNDSLQTGCPNGAGTYIVRGSERHEWLRETGVR